jgi:hypothetical protein
MSVDLVRVLVPSTGQHDALDALVSYLELDGDGDCLGPELADARRLAASGSWATDDALGIGALLTAGYRLAKAVSRPAPEERTLLRRVLSEARLSLDVYAQGNPLSRPARMRLAFRELGLAIGLHAIGRAARGRSLDGAAEGPLAELLRHLPLAARIEDFWSDPAHRQEPSWIAHRHINDVMLATSLAPEGYLGG